MINANNISDYNISKFPSIQLKSVNYLKNSKDQNIYNEDNKNIKNKKNMKSRHRMLT